MSLKDLLIHVQDLEEENSRLNFLLSISRKRVYELETELDNIKSMSMFEFANTYNTPEQQAEAGHQLAKSLLGGE